MNERLQPAQLGLKLGHRNARVRSRAQRGPRRERVGRWQQPKRARGEGVGSCEPLGLSERVRVDVRREHAREVRAELLGRPDTVEGQLAAQVLARAHGARGGVDGEDGAPQGMGGIPSKVARH